MLSSTKYTRHFWQLVTWLEAYLAYPLALRLKTGGRTYWTVLLNKLLPYQIVHIHAQGWYRWTVGHNRTSWKMRIIRLMHMQCHLINKSDASYCSISILMLSLSFKTSAFPTIPGFHLGFRTNPMRDVTCCNWTQVIEGVLPCVCELPAVMNFGTLTKLQIAVRIGKSFLDY